MLFILFVFFLIASAFLANKFLTFFLSPDIFVFLRMGCSGILLLLLYCRSHAIWQKAKKHILFLILIAIFTTFFPSLLRAYALKNIAASRAAFWGALEPFISAFYLYVLYKQKITKNQFIGAALGCIASLFFIFTATDCNALPCGLFILADLAQIGSLCISRFGWIKGQEIMKQEIFTPQQLNAFCFTISGILSFILAFTRDADFSILPSLFLKTEFLLPFLYTVIIGNMIAYNLYAYALKKTIITYISIAGLSIPLFVHILSFFIFGERLSFSFFISISLIAIALFIFQKK